jgi:hypothetical protein
MTGDVIVNRRGLDFQAEIVPNRAAEDQPLLVLIKIRILVDEIGTRVTTSSGQEWRELVMPVITDPLPVSEQGPQTVPRRQWHISRGLDSEAISPISGRKR